MVVYTGECGWKQPINHGISMHKSASNYFVFWHYSAWVCGFSIIFMHIFAGILVFLVIIHCYIVQRFWQRRALVDGENELKPFDIMHVSHDFGLLSVICPAFPRYIAHGF